MVISGNRNLGEFSLLLLMFMYLPSFHNEHVFFYQKKKKKNSYLKIAMLDFPGGPVDKNPPANAGDLGLKSDPGRSHML